MKVKKQTLFLLACLVWSAAGFNIVRIGWLAYQNHLSLSHLLISLVVFILFWGMVFGKLVHKHTLRIHQYDISKQYFWHFFDGKSFLIMAFMMSFGIAIRTFHWMPEVCIAIFYSGLGSALLWAGIQFGVRYVQDILAVKKKA